MRRIIAASVALLVAAAAASYTGYWFYIAYRLPDRIAGWAEARGAEGYTVRWDGLAVGGFPASFRVTMTGASLAGARPLPFEGRTAVLIGEAHPWNLRRWHVTAPQVARVEGPHEGDAISAATLDVTVAIGADKAASVAVTAHQIAGSGAASLLSIAGADAQIVLPARPPTDHRQDGARVALQLAGIGLPRAVPSLGATVDRVTLSAVLKGAIPAGKLRDALAAWRDDGGTIELEQGTLDWGKLAASANGTLALDGALQPMGALTATIENHDAVIDAAVAGGTMRAQDANLAKVLLGLMAKPGADGNKQLTLPVTLQNRRLYLGPAQIAVLPVVTWE
ncbi:MAG TPA: DUF2125 domain-containing protein [Stellaceae bacterium]|nr:DUF2125 domain-containing protein [Stellaceae bacterium]